MTTWDIVVLATFAAYGGLRLLSDAVRGIGSLLLRSGGHDTIECELCSGRMLRKHVEATDKAQRVHARARREAIRKARRARRRSQ